MSLSPQDLADQLVEYAATARSRVNGGADDDYHKGKAQGYQHAASLLRQYGVLRWTHQRPTKEGFYWHRIADSVGQPTVRRVFDTEDGLLLDNAGFPIEVSTLDESNLWAGPIAPPRVD